MNEYELQENYCSRCERPDCMRCVAFGEHMAEEIGLDEADPSALEDCYYTNDDEGYGLP